MIQCKHLVVTRFNLRTRTPDPRWTVIGTDALGLPDDAWMKHRFGIFTRFTYPSMRSQTCQDFEWLVLFDAATSELYRYRIALLRREYSNLTPLYVEPGQRRSMVMRHLDGQSACIMTRLDNDDALHSEYVQRIQSVQASQFRADGLRFMYFNFTNGLCWDDVNKKLYHRPIKASPFLSLIQRASPSTAHRIASILFRSVYSVNHRLARPITELGGGPMWMIVCHETNRLNRPAGSRILAGDARRPKMMEGFDINLH